MPKVKEEPTMSDTTILVTVEDLINRAMGPPDANVVDFKLVQMILEILARQQRMLQQRIEIKIIELTKELPKKITARNVSSENSSQSPRLIESLKTVKQQRKSSQRRKSKDAEKDTLRETSIGEKLDEEGKKEAIKISQEEKDRLEREKNKERKEQEKTEKRAQKEKDKIEKVEIKDKKELDKAEKTEKKAQKEKERLEKKEMKARKELDKAEKLQQNAQKEKERLEKEEIKVRNELNKADKLQKMSQKEHVTLEKEEIGDISRYNQEKNRHEKDQEKKDKAVLMKTAGSSGIEITEKQIDNEKILVVEKGPTTRLGTVLESRSTGGIDFVTRSQFDLLEAAVKELNIAVSKRLLLPGYENLINDMVKSASSETMQTLQATDRIKSAEASIVKIIEMLTILAAAGALPEDIAGQVETIIPPTYEEADKSRPLEEKNSVATDTKASRSQATESQASHDLNLQPSKSPSVAQSGSLEGKESVATDTKASRPQAMESRAFRDVNLQPSTSPEQSMAQHTSTMTRLSKTSMVIKDPCVTDNEMRDALIDLKDEITKILYARTNKISTVAETAQNVVKDVDKRINVTQQLDSRISALNSLVQKYAEQLSGLGSKIKTQLQSFADVIADTSQTMASGLVKLKDMNNSAEIAAIMTLTEHCIEMESTLGTVLNEHRALTDTLALLQSDMCSLLECMKMMREEKINRAELFNGLTSKANMLQLAGVLKGVDFEAARADFERRLDQSHESFNQSVSIWAAVIKDLRYTKSKKVDLVDLLVERDAVQQQLQNLDSKIRVVTGMLGDPKIAMTARKSVGATCGSCHEPAWMEPYDVTSGAPPRLPPLRQMSAVEPTEPLIPCWVNAGPSVPRHICRRWCGGSHTMAAISSKDVQLHVQMQAIPTRKYTDYGDDGRLYMLEEELQPCMECNALDGEKTQEPIHGPVDSNEFKPPETDCICPLIK